MKLTDSVWVRFTDEFMDDQLKQLDALPVFRYFITFQPRIYKANYIQMSLADLTELVPCIEHECVLDVAFRPEGIP
jgi:hypothetical protein